MKSMTCRNLESSVLALLSKIQGLTLARFVKVSLAPLVVVVVVESKLADDNALSLVTPIDHGEPFEGDFCKTLDST